MRLIIFLIFCAFVCLVSFKKSPIWILILLVFIYFFNPEVYIWGVKELRIVYLLNIALVAVVLKYYHRIEIFGDKYSILIASMLASVYLSAFMAEVNKEVGMTYATLFFKLWIFWLLLKNILKDKIENIELFYWGALISIRILGIWGVQQYSLGNYRLEGFGGGQIEGSNQLASTFVWAMPIAFFKIFTEKNYKKIAALVCLLILFAGTICTQSRQAFLAIIFYAFYYLLKTKKKIKIIIVGVIIILSVLPLIPSEYFERMNTIGNYKEDQSATGRLDMWKAAFVIFKEHKVFGVGGRNFYLIAPRYAKHGEVIRVTHNTYFQILTEEGLLGFIIFMSLMCYTIINTGKLSRKFKESNENQKIHYLAITSQFCLFGILICCMFQNKAEHEFLYWSSAVAAALTHFADKEKI